MSDVYPQIVARIQYEERVFLERLANKWGQAGAASAFKEGIAILKVEKPESPITKTWSFQPEPAKHFGVRPNSVEQAIVDEVLAGWPSKVGMTALFHTVIVLLMDRHMDQARAARIATLDAYRETLVQDLELLDNELAELRSKK